MNKIKQSILSIVIGLALAGGISFAWTGPTVNPPGENTPAPINVSGNNQTFDSSKKLSVKDSSGVVGAGILSISGGLNVNGLAIFDGNVGVGTVSPQATLDIKNDGFFRGQPECRTVENAGEAPNFVSIATCAADEWLLTGGGECEVPGGICSGTQQGVMHFNKPIGNSWVVDCYRNDWGGDVCSKAQAICCKK